jgi:polysaccharide export outer membrane protein
LEALVLGSCGKYPTKLAGTALAVMLFLSSNVSGAVSSAAQNPPSNNANSRDKSLDKRLKPATSEAQAAALASQAPKGYRVDVDDEILISVWHEPELSQTVTIRSDGMITLPLINDLKVAGLTTDEMQTLLTEKMKNLVNDPQVTVIVKAVRSRKVYLAGNVARQGVYPISGHTTVLELLVEAGGLGTFAKTGSIYILRNENGKQVRIPFDYKKALKGKGANPELIPGDMVVVP